MEILDLKQQIEDRYAGMKAEVFRASKLRAEETEQLANCVQNDMGRISEG